jgi:anti-sigma factor RsiW
MAHEDASTDPVVEELTAYLDGELDAPSVRAVEERLARDPAYRQQLRDLERTWDLLDRLPKSEVGEQFTRTTMEMVALAATEEAQRAAAERPKLERRQRWIGLATSAVALAAGFAIGHALWPDPNRRLLEDLPVVENLDLYYQVDDVEFLRMLDREGLFRDGDSDDAP